MSLVYFTDRDLGKKFPEILRAAGLSVERHADHFQHDTPDEVWLREIGKKGWVAVTHDGRIRYKPNEKNAVVANNVALLVIVGTRHFRNWPHRSWRRNRKSAPSLLPTRRRTSPRYTDRQQPPWRRTLRHLDGSNCGIRRLNSRESEP